MVFSLWSIGIYFHTPTEKVPEGTRLHHYTLIYTLPQFSALYPTQEREADSRKWLTRTSLGSRVPFSNKQTKDSFRGVHLLRHAQGYVLHYMI